MNQAEHKARAEAITEAVHEQLAAVKEAERYSNVGQIDNLIGVIRVTCALAQVHATLATIADKPVQAGYY